MLYVLTPPDDLPPIADVTKVCQHPIVTCFQVRLKSACSLTIAQAVRRVQPLCRAHHVACFLNDDVDMAQALGCDGVHLGEEDTAIAVARKKLGPNVIIGASCYDSLALAHQAQQAGANYVAFGAVYPTTTKDAKTRAPLSLFGQWHDQPVNAQAEETFGALPSVAIGGISLESAAEVLQAGATAVALSSAIWRDVDAALRGMDKLMNMFGEKIWKLTPTT